MAIAQKRLVRVILDIECYDDLDLENINWAEVLDLEGDESVDSRVRELGDVFWLCHLINWHKTPCNIASGGLNYIRYSPIPLNCYVWSRLWL
jgi:hypothetical protein